MIIGIIGIGQIGSSLAKSLKSIKTKDNKNIRKYDLIYGFDIDEKSIKEAKKENIYEKIVSFEEIQKSDVIFIATNITAIIKILNSFGDIDETCTIIDLGSTKKTILDNIPKRLRKNYIPSHPMAGKEKSGVSSADETLYKNQIIIICDTEQNSKHQSQIAKSIFDDLNMETIYMNSKDHDEHACYVSHMPHIISFSLANTVLKHENINNIVSLAGGGFKDMSRIAKSSPLMWIDIFKNNKNNMIKSLKTYNEELSKAIKMIEDDKWDDLSEWVKKANSLHNIL